MRWTNWAIAAAIWGMPAITHADETKKESGEDQVVTFQVDAKLDDGKPGISNEQQAQLQKLMGAQFKAAAAKGGAPNVAPRILKLAIHPTTEKALWLGVTTDEPDAVVRAQLGLNKGFGLLVNDVVPNSPAAAAGVKQYDILQKIDDQLIVNREQLTTLIRSHKVGDEVKLGVIHAAKPQTISIKLAEHEFPAEAQGPINAEQTILIENGLRGVLNHVAPAHPELAQVHAQVHGAHGEHAWHQVSRDEGHGQWAQHGGRHSHHGKHRRGHHHKQGGHHHGQFEHRFGHGGHQHGEFGGHVGRRGQSHGHFEGHGGPWGQHHGRFEGHGGPQGQHHGRFEGRDGRWGQSHGRFEGHGGPWGQHHGRFEGHGGPSGQHNGRFEGHDGPQGPHHGQFEGRDGRNGHGGPDHGPFEGRGGAWGPNHGPFEGRAGGPGPNHGDFERHGGFGNGPFSLRWRVQGAPGGGMGANRPGRPTIKTIIEGDRSFTLIAGPLGKTLIVNNTKTHQSLFHGPVGTPQERAAVPADLKPILEKLEKGQGDEPKKLNRAVPSTRPSGDHGWPNRRERADANSDEPAVDNS